MVKERKKTAGKHQHPMILIGIIIILFIFPAIFNKNIAPIILSYKKANKIHGWLHTKGTKILDEQNNEITLKGINYSELMPVNYVYQKPDLTNLPEVCKKWVHPPTPLNAKDINDLGFNTVRLVINWDSLEPQPPVKDYNGNLQHNWNMDYVKAIDQAITDLKNQNIAVILDMHQYLWSSAFKYIAGSADGYGCSGSGMPAWLYPYPDETNFQEARCNFFKGITDKKINIDPLTGFKDVWRFIAERYKNNDTVIGADIINEPFTVKNKCSAQDMQLDRFYEILGKTILQANPHLLIIFEDSDEITNGEYAIIKAPNIQNAVYSYHLYSGSWIPNGRARLDAVIARSRQWNVPLFIGEFDAYLMTDNLYTSPFPDKQTNDAVSMMKYLKENKLSWAIWAYSGQQSILVPDTAIHKKELVNIIKLGF